MTPVPLQAAGSDADPGIYAPYQPRFEWNLWFASLGGWRTQPWVVNTELRLLAGSPPVLRLFAHDPFDGQPPDYVRVVRWQYWFTNAGGKAQIGGVVAAAGTRSLRAHPEARTRGDPGRRHAVRVK